MQKVTLILVRIRAAQELHARFGAAHARIVARRDPVGSHRHGVVEEGAELDFGVAEDVGIGGASRAVFAKEVREYPLLILFGEIDGLDVDADHVRGGRRVDEVLT